MHVVDQLLRHCCCWRESPDAMPWLVVFFLSPNSGNGIIPTMHPNLLCQLPYLWAKWQMYNVSLKTYTVVCLLIMGRFFSSSSQSAIMLFKLLFSVENLQLHFNARFYCYWNPSVRFVNGNLCLTRWVVILGRKHVWKLSLCSLSEQPCHTSLCLDHAAAAATATTPPLALVWSTRSLLPTKPYLSNSYLKRFCGAVIIW